MIKITRTREEEMETDAEFEDDLIISAINKIKWLFEEIEAQIGEYSENREKQKEIASEYLKYIDKMTQYPNIEIEDIFMEKLTEFYQKYPFLTER
ncbi:MAG: hypothetical protein GY870_15380 [archaeon]|nr:hypothetical protein [archaeon]